MVVLVVRSAWLIVLGCSISMVVCSCRLVSHITCFPLTPDSLHKIRRYTNVKVLIIIST